MTRDAARAGGVPARLTRALVLAGALGLTGPGAPGCATAPGPVSLAAPERAPGAGDYGRLLRQWTRHGHVLHDFDEALTVDATLHGPEFVAALGSRLEAMYRLAPDEAARRRVELEEQSREALQLHVESVTHDHTLNELQPGRGVWRVSLVDDKGRVLSPSNVTPSKARRELDLALYPYGNVFTRGWLVRFPRQLPDGTPFLRPDTRALTLRVAGPAGVADLTWDLR